jgi:hypothetical protein
MIMSEAKQFPDAGIYLDDLVATGKPSLGDLHTVSWLVRNFGKFVLEKRSDFHAGKAGAENPLPAIEAEAALMGAIFQGQDERFDAQPWNTAARIGNLCRVLCPDETREYGDPVKGMFMWVASQTIAMMQAIEDGDKEAIIKPKIDAMYEDITARLLGAKY